eukprot:scaffold144423_cov193-Phaeocystis_antarctica.AAC.1
MQRHSDKVLCAQAVWLGGYASSMVHLREANPSSCRSSRRRCRAGTPQKLAGMPGSSMACTGQHCARAVAVQRAAGDGGVHDPERRAGRAAHLPRDNSAQLPRRADEHQLGRRLPDARQRQPTRGGRRDARGSAGVTTITIPPTTTTTTATTTTTTTPPYIPPHTTGHSGKI